MNVVNNLQNLTEGIKTLNMMCACDETVVGDQKAEIMNPQVVTTGAF